jgi:hypothetical protein
MMSKDITITIGAKYEPPASAKKLINLRRRNKRAHFQDRSVARWAKGKREIMVIVDEAAGIPDSFWDEYGNQFPDPSDHPKEPKR